MTLTDNELLKHKVTKLVLSHFIPLSVKAK